MDGRTKQETNLGSEERDQIEMPRIEKSGVALFVGCSKWDLSRRGGVEREGEEKGRGKGKERGGEEGEEGGSDEVVI